MTCNERLEKTLNRAGQTISDLPKPNEIGMPYRIDKYESLLKAAADFTQFNAPAGFEVFNAIQYALHLTDIIDRLEWALENMCGERDYLIKEYLGCESCTFGEGASFDEEPCKSCENYCKFEWSIPEDWSADDENR